MAIDISELLKRQGIRIERPPKLDDGDLPPDGTELDDDDDGDDDSIDLYTSGYGVGRAILGLLDALQGLPARVKE